MKRKIVLGIFYAFLCAPVWAQHSADALRQLKVDVVYLASNLLEGRETGKKGEELAADYIAARFAAIGLQPKGDSGSWFQVFSFVFNNNPHGASTGESRTGKNVVGYIDNKALTTVVIGAHYDHLGYGTAGNSRNTGEPAIHNGADDNASGVAALLYVAEAIKKSKLKKNNYLFLAFSAEELGLIGSKKFVEAKSIDV
ncbi:MAG TPA: M20/M25/M40 family metallo-hydrolase, partial [Rhodothermales bacterium]|nr:M20/M25/M40 family metallo-hydrolase [Rhodothermales bacterium]